MLCLAVVLLGTAMPMGITRAGAASQPAGTNSKNSLALDSQTPWVGPGQPFDMQLAVNTGSAPRNILSLVITVYAALGTRSGFQETVGGSAASRQLDQTPELALSNYPAQGIVNLDMPIIADGTSSPGAGSGAAPTINLYCQPGNCQGVYPTTIRLINTTTSVTTATLTTYLVFASPPANTQKLRFAWVLPISIANSAVPTPAELNSLDSSLGSLTENTIPVTLDPEPATVNALSVEAPSQPRARQALADLQNLSQSTGREVLNSPYVSVDPSALVDNGLNSELGNQVKRGNQVLTDAGIRATSGTWLATGPMDQAGLSAVVESGVNQLIVPTSAMISRSEALSPAQPFPVAASTAIAPTTAPSTVAMFADAQLASDLASSAGNDPALAASRVIADLSMIYFEDPNENVARGVVLEPPAGFIPSPGFITAFTAALGSSPIVESTTIGGLFSEVPPGTGGARRFMPTSGLASGLPVKIIRTDRTQLDEFSAAISGQQAAPTARRLGDYILEGESSALRPSEQLRALENADQAFQGQLQLLSLPNAHSITLTSRAARVPFTILSAAPYVVSGELHVTSENLVFPHGNIEAISLDHPTNAAYLDVQARTSGSFSVDVTVNTVNGSLTLVHGRITVQSTVSSLIAVILSIGAVAVLLVWWARSWWSGRRQHGAHTQGAVRGTT